MLLFRSLDILHSQTNKITSFKTPIYYLKKGDTNQILSASDRVFLAF